MKKRGNLPANWYWGLFLLVPVLLILHYTGSFNRPAPLPAIYSPHELIGYLNTEANRLPQTKVDQYLVQLLDLQKISQSEYEKQLFVESFHPVISKYNITDLTGSELVKEGEVQTFVSQILQDGFKLYSSEGMTFIEIDYPMILKRFGQFASPVVSGYLDIKASQTSRHFAEDAALTVTPAELANRIIKIDEYLKETANQSFTKVAEITELKSWYLSAYLLGLNNTPAFSYDTLKLKPEFLQSYQQLVSDFPETALANLINDYLKLLEENNFKRTGAILEFAKKAK